MDSVRAQALDASESLEATASNIQRLSMEYGSEATSWAFTQWALRKKAVTKFDRAGEMLFDRDALEMASSQAVAGHHASLFPPDVVVADLTAGIGADSLALVARGPVIAFEKDAARQEMLSYNLAIHGLRGEVRGDCLEERWDFKYAFADPSRRNSTGRVRGIEEYEPDPHQLIELAKQNGLQKLVLKLSPMLPDADLRALGGHIHFVGQQDQCSEALVEWTDSNEPPKTSAVLADQDEKMSVETTIFAPIVDQCGTYLFHAHACAIRAGALPQIANQHGLSLLADSNGYLTGHEMRASAWFRRYKLIAECKGDVGDLKRLLVGLDSATPEIKSRAGIDVDKLRKQLRLSGKIPHSVAAYRVGKSLRFAILRPV